jgi:hypothetical protein
MALETRLVRPGPEIAVGFLTGEHRINPAARLDMSGVSIDILRLIDESALGPKEMQIS